MASSLMPAIFFSEPVVSSAVVCSLGEPSLISFFTAAKAETVPEIPPAVVAPSTRGRFGGAVSDGAGSTSAKADPTMGAAPDAGSWAPERRASSSALLPVASSPLALSSARSSLTVGIRSGDENGGPRGSESEKTAERTPGRV